MSLCERSTATHEKKQSAMRGYLVNLSLPLLQQLLSWFPFLSPYFIIIGMSRPPFHAQLVDAAQDCGAIGAGGGAAAAANRAATAGLSVVGSGVGAGGAADANRAATEGLSAGSATGTGESSSGSGADANRAATVGENCVVAALLGLVASLVTCSLPCARQRDFWLSSPTRLALHWVSPKFWALPS